MPTLVDSNVLLDVLTNDPIWFARDARRYRTYFPRLNLVAP